MTTPKIEVIPTPAQARILGVLGDFQGLRILWGKTAAWTGISAPIAKRQLGNPKVSTLRKMKREGWIEPIEEGANIWEKTHAGEGAYHRYDGDLIDKPKIVTADDIMKALHKQYGPPEFVLVPEVRMDWIGDRRIDALAVPIYYGASTIGFEIKVSRSDFLHELKDPRKREASMQAVDYFYFVAPAGVIAISEVPIDCGLYRFHADGLSVVLAPNWIGPSPPTWALVGAIVKRLIK